MILKSHEQGSELYNKFKNSLFKITLLSPWKITFGHFFSTGSAIFVRHHFLWVFSYLFILGRVFFICYFCKVSLFSNGTKGCLFCEVPFLLDVSDAALLGFFICSYVHKEYFEGVSNCDYLLFYQ